MSNIGKHSLEDIKLFMICILCGEAEREYVLTYLCALSDYSDISYEEDFEKESDMTATVFFIEESMTFLDRGDYDGWIEYFKQQLIKIENYTLIHQLHL